MYSEKDIGFMGRALALAKRGLGRTGVNPLVGAVIVKGGKVIGEGWHIKSRLHHAEIVAMGKLSRKRMKGAVMYVTMEPCCHTAKTTPPCVNSLIEAGFSRIFVAMKDPNPLVNGRGIRMLQKAGVCVDVGLMKNKASALNEFYTKSIGTSLPYVTLKQAVSLDGRIAANDGSSRWITCKESRKAVHRMRKEHDAVMTTGITVKTDDPGLGVRLVKGRDPMRIVIDWTLITDPDAKVYRDGNALVIADRRASSKRVEWFKKNGVKVVIYDRVKGLEPVLKDLYGSGCGSILVEAGGRFAAVLLRDKLVDKAVYFIAPLFLGEEGKAAVGRLGIEDVRSGLRYKMDKVVKSGTDVRVEISFKKA